MRFRDKSKSCSRKTARITKSRSGGNDIKSMQLPDLLQVNGKDMTASARINTDAIDYQRGVILASGVGLDNYKQNPIVLFEHGLSTISYPIATSQDPDGNLAVDRQEYHIDATSWFSQRLEEAYQVFALIDEGIIRATSIQVVPYKKAYYTDDEGERYEVTEESDMVEWSWCAMGVNPEALRRSMVNPSSQKIKEAVALQSDYAAAVLDRGSLGGSRLLAPIRKSLQAMIPKASASSIGLDNTENTMALRHLTALEVRHLSGRSLKKAMNTLYDFDAPTRRRVKSLYSEMTAGDETEEERLNAASDEKSMSGAEEKDGYIMGKAEGRPQAKSCTVCDQEASDDEITEAKSLQDDDDDRDICPECAENEVKSLEDVMGDEEIPEPKSLGEDMPIEDHEGEDLEAKMMGDAYSLEAEGPEHHSDMPELDHEGAELEAKSFEDMPAEDHEGAELADDASMIEADDVERKTLGANVTEELYDAIKLLYDHFSGEMKSVEKDGIKEGVGQELESIKTSLSTLEGIYSEEYPSQEGLDDRKDPDTDSEFASQMKALLAANRRSGYQVLGLVGRIDRIAADRRTAPTHRKSLHGLSRELKRIRGEAKSFSRDTGAVVAKRDYDRLLRKYRDLESSTHTLLDLASEKILPAS